MPLKTIITGILIACGFILFLMTYYTVQPNERAVLTRFGAIVAIESEGLHFKTPFVNSVQFLPMDIQDIAPKQAVNTYTIDNQEVDVNFNLFYRLPPEPEKLEYIVRFVKDYKQRLESIAVDRLKAEMGKINVAHVAEKRGELRDKIKVVITASVQSLGLIITDFQLTNLEYTKSFKAAVEAAASAKANVETRIQELEQAKQTAERVRTEAKGQADAKVTVAQAGAQAIELRGRAEAAAIEAQAKALAANTGLTELRKAERWDGKLPATMLSNVVPFMGVNQGGIKP